MSRIQEILSKAERDGTARRTRSLRDEYAGGPGAETIQNRAAHEPPPAVRHSDGGRPLSLRRDSMPPPHEFDGAPRGRRQDGQVAVAESAGPDAAPPFTDLGFQPDSDRPAHNAERIQVREPALDPLLVAALAPTSLAAEQYRSLRTRLKRLEGSRMLRTIAITSPAKGDGKSLTAANLALTMAQEFQQRVLLVDADLRRPTVHRLFGIAEAPGLADVIMNAAELEEALVSIPEHQLTILPAGVPPGNPAELLGAAAARRLFEALGARFDRIVIDVPPVAPLADLHILAPMVDGLLMIVRAGVTPKPAIERALAGLDASKVLGLVLNESAGAAPGNYNYEGYGYVAG